MKYGGKYYDPSYGTGPFGSQNDWENASLDGFSVTVEIIAQVFLEVAKPNDPNVVETIFTLL